MDSVLKIENLKYKDILKNVTFSLEENSFNILVGPNGSGKTTLVNAIRGLIKFEGNITIFNYTINQKKTSNFYKNIGFFIDERVYFEDTVFNELFELLINLGYDLESAKKRIYTIFKKFNIMDILFKKSSDLLYYEEILVRFIFSIIHEPKLLILDDDFEILNDSIKNKIFNYIKSQKKLTTLFVTNNSEYFYGADKILFLKEGKILDEVSFKELHTREKNLIKCNSSLPFLIDLSNKLISYELIDDIILNIEEMVNKIWK